MMISMDHAGRNPDSSLNGTASGRLGHKSCVAIGIFVISTAGINL